MGAWGIDILENDDAMDFVTFWDDYIERALQKDPEFWTPERITDFFTFAYFKNSMDYDNPQTNAELLALGALFLRRGLPLPQKLKEILEQAINTALKQENIQEWDEPRKRRKALEGFLRAIGGKKIEVKNPKLAEAEQLKNFCSRFKQWVRTVKGPYNDDDFGKLYPKFLDSLAACMRRGISQVSTKTDFNIQKYRLMLLAFYTGWKVDCSEEEIHTLIKKAEKTKGIVLI